MCGIVGMCFRRNSKHGNKHDAARRQGFTAMLSAAQVRGSAATGVVLISRGSATAKPKARIFKAPLPAKKFIQTAKYKDLMSHMNQYSLSIIGHTRAVTGGALAGAGDNKNNHPHWTDNVVGVHNGVVSNDDALWRQYKNFISPIGNCDSEVIFAVIQHKLAVMPDWDTERAVAETHRELKGYAALALVNMKEPGKVFLVKDSHSGPMELMWHDYTETAYFGSSESLCRAGITKRSEGNLIRYKTKQGYLITLNSDAPLNEQNKRLFIQSRKISTAATSKERKEFVENNKTLYERSLGR